MPKVVYTLFSCMPMEERFKRWKVQSRTIEITGRDADLLLGGGVSCMRRMREKDDKTGLGWRQERSGVAG